MGWEWLSDLTAVTSVLCLPMGGFLASHLGAEEDARQGERSGKIKSEGGRGIKARQERTGCRVSLPRLWLLVHPIHYAHYHVPGQMHYRKRC